MTRGSGPRFGAGVRTICFKFNAMIWMNLNLTQRSAFVLVAIECMHSDRQFLLDSISLLLYYGLVIQENLDGKSKLGGVP